MPALEYRRRQYLHRRRQPKKFLWTLQGPYLKTGSGISGYVGAGKDEWVLNETGAGIINASVGSGADAFTDVDTGSGIINASVGSGTDAFTDVDTGSGIINASVGSGSDAFTDVDTGAGIINNAFGSGTDAFTDIDSGSGISGYVGSGTEVKVSISLLLRSFAPIITRRRRR